MAGKLCDFEDKEQTGESSLYIYIFELVIHFAFINNVNVTCSKKSYVTKFNLFIFPTIHKVIGSRTGVIQSMENVLVIVIVLISEFLKMFKIEGEDLKQPSFIWYFMGFSYSYHWKIYIERYLCWWWYVQNSLVIVKKKHLKL